MCEILYTHTHNQDNNIIAHEVSLWNLPYFLVPLELHVYAIVKVSEYYPQIEKQIPNGSLAVLT